MNDNWYKRIIGARTIKTGLAFIISKKICYNKKEYKF